MTCVVTGALVIYSSKGKATSNQHHSSIVLDYDSEAWTFICLLGVPYFAMMLSMYPVQPIILADRTIVFGRVSDFFPAEILGWASPVLCFLYTLLFAVPKYVICDLMLLTVFLGTDLECKLISDGIVWSPASFSCLKSYARI